MSFQWPIALLGLLLIPVLVGLYLLAQRRRATYAAKFTNLDLLASVVAERPSWRRHVPAFAYALALVLLVVAVARPETTLSVDREQATVVLATDISASMKAVDVDPSRLAAAQDAANGFLDELPEQFRVGLVAFSDAASTVVPPTEDRTQVIAAITRLQTRQGTAMGDAIERSLDDLEASGALSSDGDTAQLPDGELQTAQDDGDQQAPASILLLSDGESTTGTAEPLDAAERARELGVPIYTIALGTDEGEVTVPDQLGNPQTIPVPPDRDTLKRVADVTGGAYFDAPDEVELQAVYDRLSSQLGSVEEKTEITAAFAAAALVMVLLGAVLSVLWFQRFP